MKPKRYIVWSTNKEIDLDDPGQRKWYIGEVLSHGRAEDIAELDWDEVKKLLPELPLLTKLRIKLYCKSLYRKCILSASPFAG